MNLGEFEMIQEKIAYMYTKFRTSKLLCNYALESLKSSNMNAIDAAAAILYTAESAEYAAREAIQIHGGYGYIRGSEVERLLRDAILGQIGAGTTEIRKKLVASGLLKYYKKNERLPDED